MCVRSYSSDVADAIHLDEKLEAASKLPPNIGPFKKSFTGMCKSFIKLSYTHQFLGILFYIYTSGTTGLPKPAIVRHSK